MARFLPPVLVVALLGGSAAAFAVTERLKLERSPILRTQVDKVVSPTADQKALIAFRLRKADRVTLAIVNSRGDVVRTLITAKRRGRGTHRFYWDGRDDAGVPLPDGVYKPRVHLAAAHRTILMPNPIAIDTKAPAIRVTGLNVRVFSPDGDYKRDYLRIRYAASEDVRPALYANGHLVVLRKVFAKSGAFIWTGRADGLPRPAGTYRLQVQGIDRAGNRGDLTRPFTVRIRYIVLAKHLIRARVGGRIVVRVSTDTGRYAWRIGPRHGRVSAARLELAAGSPGRYRLVVSARGHKDSAIVLVRP